MLVNLRVTPCAAHASETRRARAVRQLSQRMAHHDNSKEPNRGSEFVLATGAWRRAPLTSHPAFAACASLPLEVTRQDLRLVNKST